MCGAPDQAAKLPPGTDLSKETVLTGRVVAGGEPVGGALVRLMALPSGGGENNRSAEADPTRSAPAF